MALRPACSRRAPSLAPSWTRCVLLGGAGHMHVHGSAAMHTDCLGGRSRGALLLPSRSLRAMPAASGAAQIGDALNFVIVPAFLLQPHLHMPLATYAFVASGLGRLVLFTAGTYDRAWPAARSCALLRCAAHRVHRSGTRREHRLAHSSCGRGAVPHSVHAWLRRGAGGGDVGGACHHRPHARPHSLLEAQPGEEQERLG